jgi:nucleoside-diphosphate-sugar epimerase
VRDHPNFYFAQQDLLEERAGQGGFAWTIFRPQVVLGVAIGSAMNPVAALGAYAVIQRELGLSLRHPGHAQLLTECTDARLVAAAIEWSWREPRTSGEAFNIANGDVVVWHTFFERLAGEFGMKLDSSTRGARHRAAREVDARAHRPVAADCRARVAADRGPRRA